MSDVFKISEVGIDTTRINTILGPEEFESFQYIHTSISSGNDTTIKGGITSSHILITSIDFLDSCDVAVMRHLDELGKDKVDLLLVDSDCKVEDNVDILNNLIISGFVSEVGIKNPKSVKRLEELRKKISEISYVSLDICPLCFPWSIIKYCQENNIKILGFNPFGGRINYTRLIEGFSVPYLLSFISAYSDIVFLSGSRLDLISTESEYLLDLINREYGKEFVITQDVNKLLKDPKKAVNTSLKLDDNTLIPFDNGELVFSYPELSFNLGKIGLHIPAEITEGEDRLVDAVYDYYKTISDSPADNPSPINKMSLLRYTILDLTRMEYPEINGWKIFCTKVSDLVFVISGVKTTETKRFLKKSKKTTEQVNYILYYNGSQLVFRNLKNALGTE